MTVTDKSFLRKDKPVQLHIMHSWGGGLERWVLDFCSTDSRTNLILKSTGKPQVPGQQIELYTSIFDKSPIQSWNLDIPIYSTAVTHKIYRQILSETIAKFKVEFILVSSFIGHSLDLLNTPVKTVIIGHDYYPFCPALNIYFNQLCQQCDKNHIQKCSQNNEFNRFFPQRYTAHWMTIRNEYLKLINDRNIPLIVPSKLMKNNLIKINQEFRKTNIIVTPHGVDLPNVRQNLSPITIEKKRKLKLLVLGRLYPQKGLYLLKDVCKAIYDIADIYLLGCGNNGRHFLNSTEVKIVSENYTREELYQKIKQISPDIGLLLSVVPETFSYTLSELFILGIPPLATNLGSFTERIRDNYSGFLVRPKSISIIHKVKQLNSHRKEIEKVAQNLKSMKVKSLQTMVNNYHEILSNKIVSSFVDCQDITLNSIDRHLSQTQLTITQLHEVDLQIQTVKKQLEEVISKKIDYSTKIDSIKHESHLFKSAIEGMESSKFWQLRTQWFHLKEILTLLKGNNTV